MMTRVIFWEKFDACRDASDWKAQHSALHDAYYLEIADAAGIRATRADLITRCRAALATGDRHLNTIPLAQWDAMVPGLYGVSRELKARGDWLSLGTGVCVLKCVYRRAALQVAS